MHPMLLRLNPLLLRQQNLLLGIGAGLIFLLVFSIAYQKFREVDYMDRDDGVITLSHARNLVDHGFIGVEASGQRVEGFSAPLQFWLYALAYKLTGVGWEGFGRFQTYFCTFWMGFFVVLPFGRRPLRALLLTLGVALLLSRLTRFMAWHGSGMENAWLHMAVAGMIALLHRAFEQGRLPWYWGIAVGLAMLIRLDSIFHVLPLLLVFSVAHFWEWRDIRIGWVTLVALAVWGLYQCWRYSYFGTLSPNTGLAQGIDPGFNLRRLMSGNDAWLREGLRLAWENMRVLGVWMVPFGFLCWPFVRMRPEARWTTVGALMLLFTAFFNPMVFGQTRLDPARTTTFAALAGALVMAQMVLNVQWRHQRMAWLGLAISVVGIVLLEPGLTVRKVWVCCGIYPYEGFTKEGLAFQEENELHRITFSSPDLGKLSYQKHFNMFDMGFLGSPLISRLKGDEDALRHYFYGFGQPDIVESHGEWSLLHAHVFADPRFRELYVPLHETRVDFLESHARDWPTVTEGVYVRKALLKNSGSGEYQLIQALRRQLGIDPLRQALASSVNPSDPTAHQYVVRTAYRFMPEFRDADLGDSVIALFRGTPSAAFDQALLGSADDPHWLDKAWGWLGAHLQGHELQKYQAHVEVKVEHLPRLLREFGRLRLYLGKGHRLWVSLFDPSPSELESQWFVHTYARDSADVQPPNPWKASFHDFNWDPDCAAVDHGEWIQFLQLPPYPLRSLMVGRAEKGAVVFSKHFTLGIAGW